MRACQRKWGVSLIPETDPHDQGINLLVYYCLSWGTHVKANPQPLTLNKKDIKEQMQLPVFNTPLWSLWGSFNKHKLEELNMKIQSTSDSYNMQKKNPTKQEWLTASILVRKGNWSIPRLWLSKKNIPDFRNPPFTNNLCQTGAVPSLRLKGWSKMNARIHL